MGANASVYLDSDPGSQIPRLSDMPEACIASILSYLDPPDICKMAQLNKGFWAASSADFIWDSKLPSNYMYILKTLIPDVLLAKFGKSDIYAFLSKRNIFDSGRKEVWIDKRTGGVCLSVSWKAMSITGIDDRRYWNHIPTDESRFQTIAYLQQIWWLEVIGDLEFQFPTGTYSLFFRLQLGKVVKRIGRRVSQSDNIHGWDLKPVEFQLRTDDGQNALTRHVLNNIGNWEYYHVGDFHVEDSCVLTKIKFLLTQIDCTHTKGGLCVDSVLICPKGLGKQLCSRML